MKTSASGQNGARTSLPPSGKCGLTFERRPTVETPGSPLTPIKSSIERLTGRRALEKHDLEKWYHLTLPIESASLDWVLL